MYHGGTAPIDTVSASGVATCSGGAAHRRVAGTYDTDGGSVTRCARLDARHAATHLGAATSTTRNAAMAMVNTAVSEAGSSQA